MNKKEKRHHLIKEIISHNHIDNQQQLLEHLNKHGIDATQATISRDMQELKIHKVHDGSGRIHYSLFVEADKAADDKLKEVFKDFVNSVAHVQVMNIIATPLGAADIVAAEIDELHLPEIVGTLAGTDTLVLISKTEAEAKALNKQLLSYLN